MKKTTLGTIFFNCKCQFQTRVFSISPEDSCLDIENKLTPILFQEFDLQKIQDRNILPIHRFLDSRTSAKSIVRQILSHFKLKHALKEVAVTLESLSYIK